MEEADNALQGDQEDDSRAPQARSFPLLFGKFLVNPTAFLSLEDISDNLPRYDESVISVDMDDALQQAYEQLEGEIRSAMKEHRGNKSLMSILLNTLLLYPDHPYDFDEIWARAFDPQTKKYVKFLVRLETVLRQDGIHSLPPRWLRRNARSNRSGRRPIKRMHSFHSSVERKSPPAAEGGTD